MPCPLPMDEELNLWVIGGAAAIGLVFGAVVKRSRFCLVAAVSNFILMRDFRQLHAFLLALAVATLGAMVLEAPLAVVVIVVGMRIRSSGCIGRSPRFQASLTEPPSSVCLLLRHEQMKKS